MKKKKQISKLLILIPLFLSFFAVYSFATWVPPTEPPPGGNPGGFLHEGSATQFKHGGLTVQGAFDALSVQLDLNSSKPACDEGYRGMVWIEEVEGEETVFVCKWNGSVFIWFELFE